MIPSPPETPGTDPGTVLPEVTFHVERLRKRADFLALNRGRRQGTASMLVQGRYRADGCGTVRVGFTCSRKVGNAVARNRAKRRLREVARQLLPVHGRPGWDYALIGRRTETAERPFEDLKRDFRYALRKLHGET